MSAYGLSLVSLPKPGFIRSVRLNISPFLMSLLSGLMCLLLVVAPMVSMTGCTQDQLVQVIDTLDSQIPQIAQMATGLTLLMAPEYATLVGPIAAAIAHDGKLLEALVAGYKPGVANPTLAQKINALWLDIQTNLQAMVSAVGVKNATTTGIVMGFGGLIGVIATNIVNLVKLLQPATSAQALQQSIPGVVAVAQSAQQANPSTPHMTARDIAKHWNKLCSGQSSAKIPVPKAHFLGVPVPFTGGK